MRDIKFRGQRADAKEWVYGDLYATSEIPMIVVDGIASEYENFVVVIPETIGQYTGLKDKNGKEIYEGDIVKYKVKGSNKTYTTVMRFNEDHGAFLFGIYEGVKMPCGKKTRMNKYTRKSVGSVEVIGNIYEKPKLEEELQYE